MSNTNASSNVSDIEIGDKHFAAGFGQGISNLLEPKITDILDSQRGGARLVDRPLLMIGGGDQ